MGGGPHNQSITALAVALKAAQAPEFKEYQEQVLKNAQALGKSLSEKKFDLVSGGTSNHLLLLDLRSKGVNGNKSELVCENTSMTTRGLVEEDFARVGEFLGEAVDVAAEIQKTSGPKMSEFRKVVKDNPPKRMTDLKAEVEDFANKFATIGF